MSADLHVSSPSTKKQRQLIAIGCSQLGIDAGTRHEMLRERFGVDSSTRLSRAQAEGFLAELKGRGFVIRPRVKRARSRKGRPGVKRAAGVPVAVMVSQAELDKIAAVAGLIRWRRADGFDRWIRKRFGLERVRTSHDAFRVIEGLKKMFEHQMQRQYGAEWWVRVYEDPAIERYKDWHCPEKYQAMMLYARQQATQRKEQP